MTVGIAVAILVVIIAGFFLLLRPAPEPQEPAITGPERGADARALIDELREAEAVDYDAAYDRARDFHVDGQLADAQLLYFFAARNGHARAAFELGTMNDPRHHSPETSLLAEPDPFQAYRWYNVARENGIDEARTRLEALRAWAERAADNGNGEAARLLLQWQ